MDINILEAIESSVRAHKKCALVTIIESVGSTPRKIGSMMAVFEEESIGSIGGGIVEFEVIQEARKAMRTGESKCLEYGMGPTDKLALACGGQVKLFIKVMSEPNRLIIIGAGHIGKALTYIAKSLDFEITVLDDRAEYSEFNDVKVITGDLAENIRKLNLKGAYCVIASRGHQLDLAALREVISKELRYIGMVGSKKKVLQVVNELIQEGVEKELFNVLYAPIGLNFSNGTPSEIAIEIISEILLIKNGGKLAHRRLEEFKI